MDRYVIYFILGVVAYQVLRMCYKVLDMELRERRQRRFLHLVNIITEAEQVTYITVDTSDKRAMAKMEKYLREEYGEDAIYEVE